MFSGELQTTSQALKSFIQATDSREPKVANLDHYSPETDHLCEDFKIITVEYGDIRRWTGYLIKQSFIILLEFHQNLQGRDSSAISACLKCACLVWINCLEWSSALRMFVVSVWTCCGSCRVADRGRARWKSKHQEGQRVECAVCA